MATPEALRGSRMCSDCFRNLYHGDKEYWIQLLALPLFFSYLPIALIYNEVYLFDLVGGRQDLSSVTFQCRVVRPFGSYTIFDVLKTGLNHFFSVFDHFSLGDSLHRRALRGLLWVWTSQSNTSFPLKLNEFIKLCCLGTASIGVTYNKKWKMKEIINTYVDALHTECFYSKHTIAIVKPTPISGMHMSWAELLRQNFPLGEESDNVNPVADQLLKFFDSKVPNVTDHLLKPQPTTDAALHNTTDSTNVTSQERFIVAEFATQLLNQSLLPPATWKEYEYLVVEVRAVIQLFCGIRALTDLVWQYWGYEEIENVQRKPIRLTIPYTDTALVPPSNVWTTEVSLPKEVEVVYKEKPDGTIEVLVPANVNQELTAPPSVVQLPDGSIKMNNLVIPPGSDFTVNGGNLCCLSAGKYIPLPQSFEGTSVDIYYPLGIQCSEVDHCRNVSKYFKKSAVYNVRIHTVTEPPLIVSSERLSEMIFSDLSRTVLMRKVKPPVTSNNMKNFHLRVELIVNTRKTKGDEWVRTYTVCPRLLENESEPPRKLKTKRKYSLISEITNGKNKRL